MKDFSTRVSVTELLIKLECNLSGHRKQFENAWVGYKELVMQTMEANLLQAKSKGKLVTLIRAEAPVDHSSEYTDVIGMLRMATETQIEITQDQYRCYVRDEWSWKHSFDSTNSRYSQ